MADTPETQTQNQDQTQVQPTTASEPILVAQPVASNPEAQPAPVTQPAIASEPIPVAQPVVSNPEAQPAPVAQPATVSEPIPVAQPVASNPEIQPAPVAQPVVTDPITQPVVPTPDTQPDSTIQAQTAQNNVYTSNEKKTWPIWLMASFAFLLILCGIITICAPGVYWTFMDIILGIVLILAGTSWVINSFTNEKEHGGCLLSIIGFLAILLGIIVMCSDVEFIGTLSIWAIAIWALLRGCVLIYYSLSNKEEQKFWRGILGLGILLIILFFVIAFSDKDDAIAIVGICIGLSAVLDGLCLLVLSFRVNNDPSLQDKILEQANQNEIAQGDIGTANTTNSTVQPIVGDTQQPVAQPTGEVQPGAVQQPIVAQPVVAPVATPVAQPAPETQPDTNQIQATQNTEPVPVAQPIVSTPEIQTPTTEVVPSVQTATEAQQTPETQPVEPVQTPVEEVKPVEETQTTNTETAPTEQPAAEIQQVPEVQPTEVAQIPVEESKPLEEAQPTTESAHETQQTPEVETTIEENKNNEESQVPVA